MPTLNSFIESLTQEHDKLIQMGIIQSSRDQALVAGGPKVANDKGEKKDKSPIENEQSNEPSGSNRSKKNGKGKVLFSYCGRGFHSERSCMRRQLDELTLVLKKHNIFAKGHALKARCSSTHVFLIDSRASNHMAASREPFFYFQSFYGPSIHMGNNSKFQTKGRGSINLEHRRFKYVLFVPSLA